MSGNNPHIAGRYAIIVALIGLVGTFGSILLSKHLDQKRKFPVKASTNYGLVIGKEYRISRGIDLALRSRPLTEGERNERNKCARENNISALCKTIDEKTYSSSG